MMSWRSWLAPEVCARPTRWNSFPAQSPPQRIVTKFSSLAGDFAICTKRISCAPVNSHRASSGRLVSTRAMAFPLREQVEEALLRGDEVVLDFKGVQATQLCTDELVGVLILRHGPALLDRIIFRACTDDVRAVIEFVAADRCDQYLKSHSH